MGSHRFLKRKVHCPFKLNFILKIGFKGDLNNWRKIFSTAQTFILLPGTDLTTIITLISGDTIFSAYALFLFENISTVYISINQNFRRKCILKWVPLCSKVTIISHVKCTSIRIFILMLRNYDSFNWILQVWNSNILAIFCTKWKPWTVLL